MKYSILLTLVAVSTAVAQPDLRIIRGDEPFDTYVPGLISGGALGSFGAWEYPIDETACFNLRWLEEFQGIHKFIWIDLSVMNVGDEPFNAGNPWDKPNDFIDAPSCVLFPVLDAFYAVTLTAPDGGVVMDRLLSADFWWDVIPFAADSPRVTDHYDAGISPGWVAWAPNNYLDISSVTNGNYTMTITIDPLNLWNVFNQESVSISINGFDVRLLEAAPRAADERLAEVVPLFAPEAATEEPLVEAGEEVPTNVEETPSDSAKAEAGPAESSEE